MGQLADYTGGHHLPAEHDGHQQAIVRCTDQDDNDDDTDPIVLHPNDDDVTIEASGSGGWHALNVTVREQTAAADAVVAGANLRGNGVRLTNSFVLETEDRSQQTQGMNEAGPFIRAESRKVLNGAAVVRRQAPASIEDAIRNNGHLAVLVVDMAGAGLYERYGGTFVFEYQRAILQLAREQGRRILDVVMYRPYNDSLVPTHSLLTSIIHDYDGVEVFKKPGTGGAAARNCVRCAPITRDDDTHRLTQAPAAAPAQTVVQYLLHHGITDVVVMGYDANTCVGATIFGRLGHRLAAPPTDNPNAPPPHVHEWEYEKGLLDYGFNVITSRKLLGSGGGRLASGYTT